MGDFIRFRGGGSVCRCVLKGVFFSFGWLVDVQWETQSCLIPVWHLPAVF